MLPTPFNAQDRKVRIVKHVCYHVENKCFALAAALPNF
jgi:hypothetical protein